MRGSIAALMADEKEGRDFLGVEADAPNGIVVHMDTEQGREDYYQVLARVLDRAGISAT